MISPNQQGSVRKLASLGEDMLEPNPWDIEDEELLRVIKRHAAELHAEAVPYCLIDTRR